MNEQDGPRAEQQLLGELLKHLKRNSQDERLRELAAGVLNGDFTLHAAISADAYAESLRPGLTNFSDWYQQLDDDALAEEVTRSQAQIDRLTEEG